MSDSIDTYIDTMTNDADSATEFDMELFKCFVHGGPWVTLSEYRRLKTENAELRDEIACLLSCLTDDAENARQILGESRALQSENAKLRELVRDAWGSGHPDRSCDGCEYATECIETQPHRWTRCYFEKMIEQRMRELGIEVDDA